MREQELAELLMRMATDRGIDVEPAAEELAGMTMPSFVDRRTFRAAVVQTLEAHLRTQMEQRLQSIRQRFDVDASVTPPPAPYVQPQATPAPIEIARPSASPIPDGFGDMSDATVTDLPPVSIDQSGEAAGEMEEMPGDATMVWTTRHG